VQYTSGRTGQPKGVALTHENLLANIRAMGHAAAVSGADTFVSWLPVIAPPWHRWFSSVVVSKSET
jgi:long-subunit acyl-CoA synthetase (AMP-forming)